jgi:spore coat polysaccharide biosynthesis protein SpsF
VRSGIFVQVRLGSTRLKEKAVLPLGGVTLIRQVMRALHAVPVDARALLTDLGSADRLAQEARAEGYELFAGSDVDVLARYCDACRSFGVTRVVRATGDNPLVSPRLARAILALHDERAADLSHFLGCPWGSGVEVIEAEALFTAEVEAGDPEEREHVTAFHYKNRGRFSILEPRAPPDAYFPGLRITVDTLEDYEGVRKIFSALYRGEPIEVEAIAAWMNLGRGRADGD